VRIPSPCNTLSGVRIGSSPSPAAWPPPRRFATSLLPAGFLAVSCRGSAPVHAPRCHRESRFSEPRRRSPTSATDSMRGHTRRAFDPRTRVGLSPRCSPAPTDAGCVGLSGALPHRGPCEPQPARAGLRAARSTCVDDADHGPGRSSKARRALLTMSRVPYSVAPRAPGSPARFAAGPGEPRGSSGRPRSVQDAASRKATPRIGPGCLRSRRNSYAIEELLPRARPNRVPLTPPHVEALLEGSHAFCAASRLALF